MHLNLNTSKMTPELMAAMGKAFPKAASSALNKTAASSRTEASKLVRERYNVKKNVLDRSISIGKRASERNLRATVKASGRGIPLVSFGARGSIPAKKTSQGVSVEVVKGRRLTVVSSFLAVPTFRHRRRKRGERKDTPPVVLTEGGNVGKLGVYVRKGKERYPIRRLYGPGIPKMFGATAVFTKLKTFAESTLGKNMVSAIEYFKR